MSRKPRTEEQKERRRLWEASRTEENRAAARRRRAEDPEKAREKQRMWAANNPGKAEALNREWYAKRTEAQKEEKRQKKREYNKNRTEEQRAAARETSRRWHAENPELAKEISLKSRYGITKSQFDDLYAAQGKTCAICKKVPETKGKGPAVDHCHATGLIRGILCGPCNLGLGYFKDTPDTLQQAIIYLQTHATGLVVPDRRKRR